MKSFSAIACLIVIAVAGCGGGGQSISTRSAHAQRDHPQQNHRQHPKKRARRRRLACHNGSGETRIPGKIIPGSQVDGYFPTQTLAPLRSQWETGDCRDFTAVDAGRDYSHTSEGLLGIYRHHYGRPYHNQVTTKTVTVPGAGPLRITKAPLGPSVETWAQERGEIDFAGKNSITGTLYLRDDTVTLNR